MSQNQLQMFSLIFSSIQTLGVVIAVFVFIYSIRENRQDREVALYDGNLDAYIDYLSICRENPELDIFEIPLQETPTLTPKQERLERMAFSQLFCLFERTYMLQVKTKKALSPVNYIESSEWQNFIQRFATRQNFRDAWNSARLYFDSEFVKFMDEKLNAEVMAGEQGRQIDSAAAHNNSFNPTPR